MRYNMPIYNKTISSLYEIHFYQTLLKACTSQHSKIKCNIIYIYDTYSDTPFDHLYTN